MRFLLIEKTEQNYDLNHLNWQQLMLIILFLKICI